MIERFEALTGQAETLLSICRDNGLRLATAESCTGGLIAAVLTEIPGSSDVFDRGFVTYSNEAKVDLLTVNPDLIARFGAVSVEVAREMAAGALAHSLADLSVSVTGVAGPGGGSPEKPVGLVFMGIAAKDSPPSAQRLELGNLGRSEIRLETVAHAIRTLIEAANGPLRTG